MPRQRGGGSKGRRRGSQGGRRGRRDDGFRDGDDRRRGRGRRDSGPRHPSKLPPAYDPPPPEPRPDELQPTDREFRGLRLYPFQAEALDAILAGENVLVAAPTGAGKTLVADYAIELAFSRGDRVVYTSPIKALSNQKYRDFRALHGDRVGIMTGDVTMQPDADLLVMTTEVFRNTLFDAPERLADFRFVVHDEIHYIDDPDRGTVWEESILHAPPQMRMVGLSATVPNVQELADWIESVRDEPVRVVRMERRPVPLDHLCWVTDEGLLRVPEVTKLLDKSPRRRRNLGYERTPARVLDWLSREQLLPVLVFCFSRKECEIHAWENRGRTLLSDDERARMEDLFDDLVARYECESTQALERLRVLALAGVAFHHAGMLPIHKEIVERLFTSGLIRVLFATETFALGINMPARAVLFLSLRKYDGEKVDYMLCRQYGQMAGRAGRQGLDDHGLVISMIDPRHDRAKGIRRVVTHPPEPVISKWDPDYSTILALYERMGDRVIETYERSFARFQRDRRSGKQRGANEREILAARLRTLSRTGYVEDGELTPKGEFTSRVNGYEVQAGELWASGMLHDQPVRRLGALLLAVVYEPRVQDRNSPPRDRGLGELADQALDLITVFRKVEWNEGLNQLTREPHFGLSAALEAWMDGRPLRDIRAWTSAREGDFVRNLRLLLQFCRQIRKALPTDERELRRTLADLMDLIDRDEVDARRQLELGQDDVSDVGPEDDDEAEHEDDDERSDHEDVDHDDEPEAYEAPPIDDEFGGDLLRDADESAEPEPDPPEPEDDPFGAGILGDGDPR